ncbi:MAG: magnesium transporter [Planctomycetota bacterium]|nr:MAG: magnesium transporter [Planctomycetota bacterium]REJ88567.1 MAG: magnesium transporter [Planctomycetota bacterium]REK17539.1 MAG: magnesium transporter [Planctomycetota bacterium]REK47448.1 MAG: magnesium transporter [Planctomycetota bacterium]
MKTVETLLRAFVDLHPEEAARVVESLDTEEATRLLKTISSRTALALVERLQPHVAAEILQRAAPERSGAILAEIDPRVASAIVQHLDEAQRSQLLSDLPEATSQSLRELAEYPAETAGGMMQTKVAALALDLTAQQAIAAIRKAPREALYYLYVTKRDGELAGVLNMRDLMLAAPRDPIEPLVRTNVVSVPATMPREEVVDLMSERKFLALPVVDFNNKLVGVVKHDEALQAGKLEAFEDFQRLVGAGAEERALSPVSVVVKSRLPWLFVNLLTAFMAAAVVGLFEGIIAQIAALAVLLPVVAGQGGNTGSQSLAVVMRGLALREIVPGTKKRVIRKELMGGIINGVLVAVVTALCVYAWRHVSGDTETSKIGLALVIFLSMIVNMAAAALSGAIIPLVLKSMGRDPAQSAAIFLTTVTDIVGFASFLGFAMIFMQMLA